MLTIGYHVDEYTMKVVTKRSELGGDTYHSVQIMREEDSAWLSIYLNDEQVIQLERELGKMRERIPHKVRVALRDKEAAA